MYQTGTSKTPAFMRPGRFQRKFESPLRYVYALAGSAEMYSSRFFIARHVLLDNLAQFGSIWLTLHHEEQEKAAVDSDCNDRATSS